MKLSPVPFSDGLLLNSQILGRMSEEDFELFCLEQKELRIERNEAGEIEIMAPAYSLTGRINAEINYQLSHWNRQSELGLVFDSSSGFYVEDGKKTMRSPDAAFIFKERFEELTGDQKKGFMSICPDFVVELKSTSDSLEKLKDKMEKYLQYGAKLGWLIDPAEEQVFIYSEGGETSVLQGFDQHLSADPVLPGFQLELSRLRIS